MNWVDGAGKQTILEEYKSELKSHESHNSESDSLHGNRQVLVAMGITRRDIDPGWQGQ